MTRSRAGVERIPNRLMAEYYVQRSSAGLLITEATTISEQANGWNSADAFALDSGQNFTKQQAIDWFAEHYPKIKIGTITAHLVRLSINAPSRIHYNPKPKDDDLFFQIDAAHFFRRNQN